jgi:di/tricarboxylate transporter
MLAMGGIALGKAVESSGLLNTIASKIEELVVGFSAFEVLFVFSCLVLVIATFISHTVAALIVLPIVAKVGSQLADPQPRMLVMVISFSGQKKFFFFLNILNLKSAFFFREPPLFVQLQWVYQFLVSPT